MNKRMGAVMNSNFTDTSKDIYLLWDVKVFLPDMADLKPL